MVRLTHVHVVDTRPFLPLREGPGDEANSTPVLVRSKDNGWPCKHTLESLQLAGRMDNPITRVQ